MLTALLQSMEGLSVSLYEKRREYTRTRMVQLSRYLVADSVESYSADYIDGDTVAAVFDPEELDQGIAFRQSISAELMAHLREWEQGFCPLNAIERTLSDLIDSNGSAQRIEADVTTQDAIAILHPGDLLVDCTGRRSLLRDHLAPGSGEDVVVEGGNTLRIPLEYALVITFLYGQTYDCNEFCKYYKNADNPHYKFIPFVHRTYYDGSVTHVTGIVHITAEDYEAMPPRFDGEWLRSNFPAVAQSMDRFIDKIKQETNGELVGDLGIVRIPLDVYRARNATNREWRKTGPDDHPFASSPVLLAGDSAIGSPYFQSISLGFECAMFLAGLIAQRDLTVSEMLDRYELFMYKQWLRVYMRSKMIFHNKSLLETIDDRLALLDKLRVY
jgi:2-polyprenyl-6-methoxyphenol hydroxylase-like FAD-dependent oxidoreductase